MENIDELSRFEIWFCNINRQLSPNAHVWRYSYQGKTNSIKYGSPEAALIAAKTETSSSINNIELVPE